MRGIFTLIAALALAGAMPARPPQAASDDAATVPPGFAIETIAHVPGARELAVAPNGDLIVGTQSNAVYVVLGAEASAAAPYVLTRLDDRPAAGVLLEGGTLYVGGQFGIYRVPFHAGERQAGTPEKIAAVRTSGTSRDHVTTSLALARGTLYASVGSSCDTCDPELDATRASIQALQPDGKGMHPKAIHIRNAIALATNPATGSLWAGVAGQDELAQGHPYEIFDDVSAHDGVADYGWPYCYENRRATDSGHSCANVAVPRVVFPAYLTPIGAAFYPADVRGAHVFPSAYRGGAFVTLHGSWHTPLRAPRVVYVPMNGDEPRTPVNWNDPNAQWHDFLGGCQRADSSRACRPTGVAVGTDGSLFVSEDSGGAIYRIRPR